MIIEIDWLRANKKKARELLRFYFIFAAPAIDFAIRALGCVVGSDQLIAGNSVAGQFHDSKSR